MTINSNNVGWTTFILTISLFGGALGIIWNTLDRVREDVGSVRVDVGVLKTDVASIKSKLDRLPVGYNITNELNKLR